MINQFRTGQVSEHKRGLGLRARFVIMSVVNLLCIGVAAASVVAHLGYGLGWALPSFIVATVGGFAAQIWFILGFRAAPTNGEGA